MPIPHHRFPVTVTVVGVRDSAAETAVAHLARSAAALGVDLTAEYVAPSAFAPTPGEVFRGRGVFVLGNDATIDDPDIRRLFGPEKAFGSNADPAWIDAGADAAHRRIADDGLRHCGTHWWIGPRAELSYDVLDVLRGALTEASRLPAVAFAWPAHRPPRPIDVPAHATEALRAALAVPSAARPVVVFRGRPGPGLTELVLAALGDLTDLLDGGVVAVDAAGLDHPSDAFGRASRVDVEFALSHAHAIGEDPRRAGTDYADRWCESCDGPFALLFDGLTDPTLLAHRETTEFADVGHLVVATTDARTDLSPLAEGAGGHPVTVVDFEVPPPATAADLVELTAAEREFLEFAALYDPALVPVTSITLAMSGRTGEGAHLSLLLRGLVSAHPYFGHAFARLDPAVAELVRPRGPRHDELMARVVRDLPSVTDNLGLEGQETTADALVGLLDRNPDDRALLSAVPTSALLFLARDSAHPALSRVVHREIDRLAAPAADDERPRRLFARTARAADPAPELVDLCLAALRLRPAPTGRTALIVARAVLGPARRTLRSGRTAPDTLAATAPLLADARDLLETGGAPADETLEAAQLAVDATSRVRSDQGTASRPWINHVHALISLGRLARDPDPAESAAALASARREIAAYRSAHAGTHMEHEIDALAVWLDVVEQR